MITIMILVIDGLEHPGLQCLGDVLVDGLVDWKGHQVMLGFTVYGVPFVTKLHVQHQDPRNPFRDFVIFTIDKMTFRVYRDGQVVIDHL